MRFGENLKQLRNIKGISQKQLAEDMNITLKTVSHWETGYSEPSIGQLINLANYFDVTIDELVGRIN